MSTNSPPGPPLKYNINRDGATVCAQYVIDVIRKQKGLFSVYLAADGGMRVIPQHKSKQPHRPDHERVGVYRRRLQREPVSNAPTVETVSEDLLKHMAGA